MSEFTATQILAVQPLARLLPDQWAIGELASQIHKDPGLTDEEISDCLLTHHARPLARSSVQEARTTFDLYPTLESRGGFGYSHLVRASRAARSALGVDATDEEIRNWVRESLAALPATSSVRRVEEAVRVKLATARDAEKTAEREVGEAIQVGTAGEGTGVTDSTNSTGVTDAVDPEVDVEAPVTSPTPRVFPESIRCLADDATAFRIRYIAAPVEDRADVAVSLFDLILADIPGKDQRDVALKFLGFASDVLREDEIVEFLHGGSRR